MRRLLNRLMLCFAVLTLLPQLAYSQAPCAAFPPPAAGDAIVDVSSSSELSSAISSASPNTTIRLADGSYSLSSTLYINQSHITLRSLSGNRDAVVIDAAYQGGSIIEIRAQHVSLADLTIKRAYYHPVHVAGGGHYATLYNLKIEDGRQQFVKVNPSSGNYNDYGTIACSHFELTSAGREYIHNNPTPGYPCYTGGLDAHQAWGWSVRDNTFENIYCTNGGLAEHCIHFWRTSREPTVERNSVINCARGIGFGLGSSGGDRTYDPNPLDGLGINPGHIGGTIRNNFVYANIGSEYDSGIGLEAAWNVTVEHNTIYSEDGNFNSAIDSRFDTTDPVLRNNLYYPRTTTRNGASPTEISNVLAEGAWFTDRSNGNLHLLSTATGAINQGASSEATDDIDGEQRNSPPDVGADEYSEGDSGTPAAPTNLRFLGS